MRLYTNPAEVENIKKACVIAAAVLDGVCQAVKPGISTYDLDEIAAQLIKAHGARSACLGYKSGKRSTPAYPANICLSVNDEVVHGIASKKRTLNSGDIISVDVVVEFNGYIGDNARTVAVGVIQPNVAKLLQTTEEALYEGIAAAKVGNRVGDISAAVQTYVEARGFSVVRDFVGHGVGRTMHEEPQIPNFGKAGSGPLLKAGMVLAIEPMINLGDYDITIDNDGWTARSADGLPSAHFEHTVILTPQGAKILTISKKSASQIA